MKSEPTRNATPEMSFEWSNETMQQINKLTTSIEGKAFDADWMLLRQRLEDFERELRRLRAELGEMKAERDELRRTLGLKWIPLP